MTDLVYALGTGSRWKNNELRYSLRAVEKYLRNYRNIYVVGEQPEWLQNAIHIPAKDKWHASKNIAEKIILACAIPDLSENFLFINDDHFFLKEADADHYPNYHCGPLKETKVEPSNWYKNYLDNTIGWLERTGRPTLNFDVHTPIRYDKKLFTSLFTGFNEICTIKSIYGNIYFEKSQVVYTADCKLRGYLTEDAARAMIAGKEIFSTGDQCLSSERSAVRKILQELYPQPSIFEK